MPSLEQYIQCIFNNDSFLIEINKGVVLPIHHPDYYKDRITIKIIRNFNEYFHLIEIGKNKYEINSNIINNIEKIISENFDRFINIAREQNNSSFVIGGTYSWTIKCGSITLKINYDSLNDSDKQFLNSLYDNIKKEIEENKNNESEYTVENAIKDYTDKFGGFPHFLFMGANDETIINAVKEALNNNKEITIDNSNVDY